MEMEFLTIWYCVRSTMNGCYPVFFETLELYALVTEYDIEADYSDTESLLITGSEGSNMYSTDVMDNSDFIDIIQQDIDNEIEVERGEEYIKKVLLLG